VEQESTIDTPLAKPKIAAGDSGSIGRGARSLRNRRILYVTHRLPYPPAGGAKVRAFHSIRHLAAHNTVTVAAPVRDAEEAEAARELAKLCAGVLTAPIGRTRALAQALWQAGTARPASLGYFHAPVLARRIASFLQREPVDLIVVHCSAVAHYVEKLGTSPKVLDFVDMDSRKWLDYSRVTGFPKNLVHAWEGWTLGRRERRLARQFDLSVVATAQEADTLRALAGEVPSAVVRNGVDLAFFHPSRTPYAPDRICFIGRMDYFPNEQAMVAFCRDVLPRIQARRPRARLTIVGADPTPAVWSLARQPGVEVTGSVEDVRPYVWRAAVTVAPLQLARGTQNKILESMAMGVPVVASDLAARGVDAVPGEHLLAATTPAETAEMVLRLLEDPAERARLGAAGRALVAARYSWSTTLRDLEACLADCLA